MIRPLTGDGEAVKLARQTDREIADVDHFLHLAMAFRDDLACFDGNQTAECILGGAQILAEQANQFAALRWRDLAPFPERGFCHRNSFGCTLRTRVLDIGDGLPGQGRVHGASTMPAVGGDAKIIRQICNVAGEHEETFFSFQSTTGKRRCMTNPRWSGSWRTLLPPDRLISVSL